MPKYNDFELDIQEEKSENSTIAPLKYSHWTCNDFFTNCMCE